MITRKFFIPRVLLFCCVLHCDGSLVSGLSGNRVEYMKNGQVSTTSTQHSSSWYRLPEYVIPISYELWILPELAVNNFTYQGHVKIHIEVLEQTDSLIVHVKELNVDREKSKVVAINSNETTTTTTMSGAEISIGNQQLDTEREFYILSLETVIPPGNYSLSLSFSGRVLDRTLGFYRSSTKVDGKIRWLGFTQFSTTYARWAFPCFDEPWLKATYKIHLGHYANETVTGNTLPEHTQQIKPGYYLTSLRETPRMSTYIVGWAIHNFEYTNYDTVATANSSTRFGLWSRENMKIHASRALEEGRKIYEALTEWINHENPIEKMDEIAVPDFYFSAMENWGMVTFRESMVLWENASTPSRSIHDALSTIAHEFAHTWFGNIVTPKFWNVAWLKEGFATFFGHYGQSLVVVNDRHSNIMDLFPTEVLQSALLADSAPQNNRTMNGQCVGSPETIRASMDFVAYKKGASIIRMIKYMIGDWAFQRGLQSYIATLKYSHATPQDVYRHLQKFSDQSNVLEKSIEISRVIESWANQPGYPVVTVTRNYTTDITKITQQRFRLNSNGKKESDNSTWWIPINFATAEAGTLTVESNPTIWMNPQMKTIHIATINSTETLLCNVHQAYYYRVNYDEINWQKLINHLNFKNFRTIGEPNRASLIDDSFNLAKGGYINYAIPLDLSRYLTREKDYGPWLAASNSFTFLNIMLSAAVPGNIHLAFHAFVNHLAEPIYKDLYTQKFTSNGIRPKLLRSLILSTLCSVNNVNCTNAANVAFKKWLAGYNDNEETIDPDEKSAIYNTGIRLGGEDDWRKVLKIFLKTELHTEKELLMSALGSTDRPILIKEFLNYSLYEGPEIPKQYKLAIFNAVLAGNPTNVEHVLDFVAENLRKIKEIREPSAVEKIFDAVKKQVVRKDQLQKLKVLVDSNIELLGASVKSARNAIEFAEENISWIQRYTPSIAKWLNVANFSSIL